MKSRIVAAGCAALLAFAVTAAAQVTNIEKLKQMKVATTDLNIPPVPQSGANADAIRENLKRVKLPPGFRIDLFAVVPDARHMAVAPSTNMLFVGTRKTMVWAVTDRNSDGIADEVKAFAPSLKFSVPNGVCWTKDGFLVVVEHNRVLNFPAAEFFYEGPDVAVIEVVPQGKLIPPEEESYNHGARTCRVGKDGMLYITLGQAFNVPPNCFRSTIRMCNVDAGTSGRPSRRGVSQASGRKSGSRPPNTRTTIFTGRPKCDAAWETWTERSRG